MAVVQGVQDGPAASSVMWCVGLGGAGWQQPPVPVHVPAHGERTAGQWVLCHLERATIKSLSSFIAFGSDQSPILGMFKARLCGSLHSLIWWL